ncbi:ornithine--oxo-acid transaminase [Anaerobranca californiensis DSM 14826]|jgi:ornithine--oxo-acid transaminase|uniref:Ornithine aminotransferase n=1 Tax=Anaerobranca californiensis DSM 14826 TaxID=1120989 RepID=A0A1M6MJV6_9FIRM|nr:ornithine--oxo-acid transaminase [Anaerobranca californiensis]SHJ83762.1 ornithine--oxo-acid transaminase [Anaerobranca californiensis DSM 14826]
MDTQAILKMTEQYSAPNYLPLPIVISKAEGVWVEDPEGKRYMDMLSSYSALNQGHRHPKIIARVKEQLDKVTLTSRAFHNDQLGPLCKKIAEITGKEKVLLMNTGAEAVETAIKCARRWGYNVKGIAKDQGEIIVCSGNFHGRTITIISFSSTESYKEGFGPLTPGFKIVPYGDVEALKGAINEKTIAFLVEPIQGEAGVIVPPEGYLKKAYEICKENNVLFLADEIQTGFGRTGKLFACQWEDVNPDIYILGKALGGGVIPISAISGNSELLNLFNPGSHGSTFGGNPLACACASAAIDVLLEEKLVEKSLELGQYLLDKFKGINNPHIVDIRGKGLFIGIELDEGARKYCEMLKEEGILCKETHENVIRFAPPLVITKEELDWAIERVYKVLHK